MVKKLFVVTCEALTSETEWTVEVMAEDDDEAQELALEKMEEEWPKYTDWYWQYNVVDIETEEEEEE